jgi:hypothetical protein
MATDSNNEPKIFLWCAPAPDGPGLRDGDVLAYALAEDGTGLARHLSSGVEFAKQDVGFTSRNCHDAYAAHYPGGYTVVWLEGDALDQDEAFLRAYNINQASAQAAA